MLDSPMSGPTVRTLKIPSLYPAIQPYLIYLLLCMCMMGDTHATAPLWRLKDNFMESVLSFYLDVGSRNQTQVAKLHNYGQTLLGR